MLSNEEIAENCRRIILNGLNWLDENERRWELDEPCKRKDFILDLLERAVIDE